MQQLDLLTIRKQPAPRVLEIRSSVIKAYVKQNLRGFAQRQAECQACRFCGSHCVCSRARCNGCPATYDPKWAGTTCSVCDGDILPVGKAVRLRREARKRETPRIKKPKQEYQSHMRTIKVTYRAVFHQPQGTLNPLGLKIPRPCPVELFQAGAKWRARVYRMVYTKLGEFASLQDAKRSVAVCFESQLEDWQMWGSVPHDGTTALTVERLILPDEIAHLDGDKIGWKQAEDYTHILHAPTIPPRARIPPAACGAKVNAKCFIDNRANVEPTCKGCAEVWRKEYQNK